MADLTTVELVKTYQEITASGDDAFIGTLIDAASNWIETVCAREFSDTIGTLTYDARNPVIIGRKLFFDRDVLDVISIVDASGTLTSDTYHLLPNNYNPKYALELKAGYGWTVDDVEGAITVVARHGYCTTANRPAAITHIATLLTQWMYQTRSVDTGAIQVAAGGGGILPPKQARGGGKVVKRGVF